MLRDLDREVVGALVDRRVGDEERGVDFGQLRRIERHVDDGANDLNNATN